MKIIARYLIPNAGALILAGLLLVVQVASARQVPAPTQPETPPQTLISYQGTLTDPAGNPINGTLSMAFALYGSLSGTDLKWGPEFQDVEVSNGLFHVLLGSVTPIDPADLYLLGNLYLDITVNGEHLTPREVLGSVLNAVDVSRVYLKNPNNEGASVWLGWSDDVARIRVGGDGAGASNGLDIQTVGDLSLMRLLGNGNIGIGTTNPGAKLEIAAMDGYALIASGPVSLWGAVGIHDNLYLDGDLAAASDISALGNIASVGNVTAEGSLAVNGSGFFGGATYWEGAMNLASIAVPLTFKESDASGQGSLWRMPLDETRLRFDSSDNGTDFSAFHTPLWLFKDGSVGCGALTENNLQTPEEQAAGRSDRFEEGDLLCWSTMANRLEKCSTPGDPLVQAVADKSGRPIVIGAEAVKVIGPIRAGDYLVASSVPGYAMASATPTFGIVIAQALEDFGGKQGVVKAMIRKM